MAPHNLSFNKRAQRATHSNREKVAEQLQAIIDKHNSEQEKKMKNMSPEMAA